MEIRHDEHRHQVTYTTAWHHMGGVKRARRITIRMNTITTPMLRRRAVEYRITVDELTDGADPVNLSEGAVSTYKAALAALGEAIAQAIRDGYADRRDLESVPRPLV